MHPIAKYCAALNGVKAPGKSAIMYPLAEQMFRKESYQTLQINN